MSTSQLQISARYSRDRAWCVQMQQMALVMQERMRMQQQQQGGGLPPGSTGMPLQLPQQQLLLQQALQVQHRARMPLLSHLLRVDLRSSFTEVCNQEGQGL